MALDFQWDPEKAHQNIQKHGVSFEEASTLFDDPLSITISDPLHSDLEERCVIVGESVRRRLLIVIHMDLGAAIRIITARVATRHERRMYEGGR